MGKTRPLQLSVEQINIIGRLINNLSFAASQLLAATRPELNRQARSNLKALRRDFAEFVKQLDSLGTQTTDLRVGRVLEDLERPPRDAAGVLTLANRCFLAITLLSQYLVAGAASAEGDPVPVRPAADAPLLH